MALHLEPDVSRFFRRALACVAICALSACGDEPIPRAPLADVPTLDDVGADAPDVSLDVTPVDADAGADADLDAGADAAVPDVADVGSDTVDDPVDASDAAQDAAEDTNEDADADAGDAAPDVPTPECDTVCFEWNDGPLHGPMTPLMFDPTTGCNPDGVQGGLCPGRTACRDVGPRWLSSDVARTNPLCLGDGGPYFLLFDFTTSVAKTLPVRVRFSRSGEAWPSGLEESAGRVVFESRETGARYRPFVPTVSGGVLLVDLPVGVYDVSFEAASLHDWTRYPEIPATGVLVVNAVGEAEIDVPAARVDWNVSIGGGVVRTVPSALDSFGVTAVGARGGEAVGARDTGAPLNGTWYLYPDTYRFIGNGVASAPHPIVPIGHAPAVGSLAVADGEVVDYTIRFESSSVAGTIRVDGEPLDGGRVEFVAPDGRLVASVPTGPDGSVSSALFPGTYDVYVATDSAPGYPRGRVLVADDLSPPATLDVDIATIAVTGEVTLDGEVPPDGFRGWIDFVGVAGGSVRMTLAFDGAATFSGRLFEGDYVVWVEGDGRTLPGSPSVVDPLWAAQPDPVVFDIASSRVRVPLTLDGRPIDVRGSGEPMGYMVFQRVDEDDTPLWAEDLLRPGSSLSLVIDIPFEDEPVVDALLSPGRYSVTYHGPDSGPLPPGMSRLGYIEVGDDVNKPFDIESTVVTVRVTTNGSAPDLWTGTHRGQVIIGTQSAELRPTGNAEATFWIARGEYDLYYSCRADAGCHVPGMPPFTALAVWLGL